MKEKNKFWKAVGVIAIIGMTVLYNTDYNFAGSRDFMITDNEINDNSSESDQPDSQSLLKYAGTAIVSGIRQFINNH